MAQGLLITIASFIFALGILIFFHELGHYLVARWCGVKVLRFSLGFGKVVASKKVGPDQTEWSLSAFPLGGYVKMLDERETEVPADQIARAFNRQSVWKRFAIVLAGPVANFILAIFFYWLLFVIGAPGIKPIIAAPAKDSAAYSAGLQSGERILSINGAATLTWQDVHLALLSEAVATKKARLEVENNKGHLAERTLDLEGLSSAELESDFLGKLGLSLYRPRIKPVFGEMVSGGAAQNAGLQAGDEIVEIEGKAITDWDELVAQVVANPGRELHFTIRRATQLMPINITPKSDNTGKKTIGRIGARPKIDQAEFDKMMVEVRYGPLVSAGKAMEKTWEMSVFSFKMIGKMITGTLSLKNISGPITIADYAGQSAKAGSLPFISFLAMISISLGVLNLLPIPLLDGGHLLYYVAEIIKGSPVSERAMQLGQPIGMVLLGGLMLVAFYNDILRVINSVIAG
ncbi:MAG: RIP metalloprotease RseP [Burkholderiales bacterium]